MKRQEAFFILITTFIAILAWIVFAILDSAASSTISQTLHVQISAISPTFNTKVIDALKKRQQVTSLNAQGVITENQASEGAKITPTVSQIPIPSPTPIKASNSATIQQIVTP